MTTTPVDPAARGRVVVGVDGSAGSPAALRWAAQQASARGLALHVVTAWDFPIESTYGDLATDGDFHPVMAAEQILTRALATAGLSGDDDTVTTAPVQGHPAEVLPELAQNCDLSVVGSRRHGTILGALLGSVSHYLAAHAPCPVVVVTIHRPRRPPPPPTLTDLPDGLYSPPIYRVTIDSRAGRSAETAPDREGTPGGVSCSVTETA